MSQRARDIPADPDIPHTQTADDLRDAFVVAFQFDALKDELKILKQQMTTMKNDLDVQDKLHRHEMAALNDAQKLLEHEVKTLRADATQREEQYTDLLREVNDMRTGQEAFEQGLRDQYKAKLDEELAIVAAAEADRARRFKTLNEEWKKCQETLIMPSENPAELEAQVEEATKFLEATLR